MLHYSKIGAVLTQKQTFSFKAVALSTGELITGENCQLASYYINTVNIVWPSGQIRKLYKVLFLEINNQKIFV